MMDMEVLKINGILKIMNGVKKNYGEMKKMRGIWRRIMMILMEGMGRT